MRRKSVGNTNALEKKECADDEKREVYQCSSNEPTNALSVDSQDNDLSNEKIIVLHNRINSLEYENVVNLERLEKQLKTEENLLKRINELASLEDLQKKKFKNLEDKENKMMQEIGITRE